MRTRLRALSALAISGLLVIGTAAVVSSEGTIEACYQQKVGNLRKATTILPCKDTSENSIILQTGTPSGGSGGSTYFVEVNSVVPVVPDWNQDYYHLTTARCNVGDSVTGGGYDFRGYQVPQMTRPVAATDSQGPGWRTAMLQSGHEIPHTVWAVCLTN